MTKPRFSVRWLFFLLLLVATYLGGFVHARLIHRHREAMLLQESMAQAERANLERLRAETVNQHLLIAIQNANGQAGN